MQQSIVFLVRVQYRRKESSRSLSHLLMSFLSVSYEVLHLIKSSVIPHVDCYIFCRLLSTSQRLRYMASFVFENVDELNIYILETVKKQFVLQNSSSHFGEDGM